MRASGRLLRAAMAALVAGATPASRGEDLVGRADVTYNDESSPATANEYLRQAYELDFRHAVSDAIAYHLDVRYQEDHGRALAVQQATRLVARDVIARGGLSWGRPRYGAIAQYEVDDYGDFNLLRPGTADRRQQRSAGNAFYKPIDALTLAITAERLDASSFTSAEPRTESQVDASVLYGVPALRVLEENRIQSSEDGTSSRIAYGPRLEVSGQREIVKGWSIGGQYVSDYMRSESRALLGVPVRTAVEVTPVAALYAVDALPLDSSDVPMQRDPALIDRNFVAGAGISIGPDGASFQNIGLDMGHVVELDAFRLNARSASGNLVPFGGPVTWTAYWSNDAVRWTPIGGETTSFDPIISAYEVGFLPTRARFFKVVDFGTNTTETAITEVQAFEHETVQPSHTQTGDILLQSVSASASAQPLQKLALSYAGVFNATGSRFDGPDGRVWSIDSNHAVNARIGPFGPLALTVDHARWDARHDSFPLDRSASTGALVSWRPLPQLEAGLAARNGDVQSAGQEAVTNSVGARLAARMYETARLSGSADYARQVLVGGGTTYYVSGSASGGFRPRTELDLGLAAQLQRNVSREGDVSAVAAVPLLQVIQYESVTASASYRPSNVLALQARVGYSRAAEASGLVQGYRVLWDALRGGAVRLALDYDQEVDPLSGRAFRRMNGVARWSLNPHATLQLNYTATRGSPEERRDMLYASFGLRT